MRASGYCGTIGLVGLRPVPVMVEVTPVWPAGQGRIWLGVDPDSSTSKEPALRLRAALTSLGIPTNGPDLAVAFWDERGEHFPPDPAFDLPALLAALVALERTPAGGGNYQIRYVGQLSLDGSVKPVLGALARARLFSLAGAAFPAENEPELGLLRPEAGAFVFPGLMDFMKGAEMRSAVRRAVPVPSEPMPRSEGYLPSLARALLEIPGLADSHRSVLLLGDAGSGTTVLARHYYDRVARLPMAHEEAVKIDAIQGVAGLAFGRKELERPFRAPHHTVSEQGLVGNASRPGEVTLAHGGVLFLDEVTEFRRSALERVAQVLRAGSARHLTRGGDVDAEWPAVPFGVVASARIDRKAPKKAVQERQRERAEECAKLLGLEVYEVKG